MPPNRPRALWIEDGARSELSHLSGPVLYDGRIELVLAEDLTTAVEYLLEEEFDAVVVDVRLPPGDDPYWKELHRKAGRDKVHAQLGLQLLRWLLEPGHKPELAAAPSWLDAKRVAVFSVDTKSVACQQFAKRKAWPTATASGYDGWCYGSALDV